MIKKIVLPRTAIGEYWEKNQDFFLPKTKYIKKGEKLTALAEAAVDCKPRYASGSLGMRPASLLSSLTLANQRARASMGLSHPRRGFGLPHILQTKNKRDRLKPVSFLLWRRTTLRTMCVTPTVICLQSADSLRCPDLHSS